jgi:hypothetical protein
VKTFALNAFLYIAMAKISARTEQDKVQAENAVRAAAVAAARGAPLSKAILSKIVAETSDPSLSMADRVQRAAVMAEQYVTSPKAINMISATPQEIAAQTAAMNFASSRVAGSGLQRGDNSGHFKQKRLSGARQFGPARASGRYFRKLRRHVLRRCGS